MLKDTVNGNGTSSGASDTLLAMCVLWRLLLKRESRSSLLYLLEKRDRDYDILRLPITHLTLIPLDLLSH